LAERTLVAPSETKAPAEDIGLHTSGPDEPEPPPAAEGVATVIAAVETPAPCTLLAPSKTEAPAETVLQEAPSGAVDRHHTEPGENFGHDDDINRALDSGKMSPAEARQYEATLIGNPDDIGSDADPDSRGEQRGSATQAGPGTPNPAELGEHSDTTLFGP